MAGHPYTHHRKRPPRLDHPRLLARHPNTWAARQLAETPKTWEKHRKNHEKHWKTIVPSCYLDLTIYDVKHGIGILQLQKAKASSAMATNPGMILDQPQDDTLAMLFKELQFQKAPMAFTDSAASRKNCNFERDCPEWPSRQWFLPRTASRKDTELNFRHSLNVWFSKNCILERCLCPQWPSQTWG